MRTLYWVMLSIVSFALIIWLLCFWIVIFISRKLKIIAALFNVNLTGSSIKASSFIEKYKKMGRTGLKKQSAFSGTGGRWCSIAIAVLTVYLSTDRLRKILQYMFFFRLIVSFIHYGFTPSAERPTSAVWCSVLKIALRSKTSLFLNKHKVNLPSSTPIK